MATMSFQVVLLISVLCVGFIRCSVTQAPSQNDILLTALKTMKCTLPLTVKDDPDIAKVFVVLGFPVTKTKKHSTTSFLTDQIFFQEYLNLCEENEHICKLILEKVLSACDGNSTKTKEITVKEILALLASTSTDDVCGWFNEEFDDCSSTCRKNKALGLCVIYKLLSSQGVSPIIPKVTAINSTAPTDKVVAVPVPTPTSSVVATAKTSTALAAKSSITPTTKSTIPTANSTTPTTNSTTPTTNSTTPATNSTTPKANSTTPKANSTIPATNSTTPTTNSTTPTTNSTTPTTNSTTPTTNSTTPTTNSTTPTTNSTTPMAKSTTPTTKSTTPTTKSTAPQDTGDQDTDDQDVSAGQDSNAKVTGGRGSYFMAYFLTVVILAIAAYLVVHNKKKILAFIVEGRNGRGGGGARSKRGNYSKLEQDMDEVVVPVDKKTLTTQNYIY